MEEGWRWKLEAKGALEGRGLLSRRDVKWPPGVDLLREAQPEALAAVHATICNKIGWDPGAGDERAFLEAFYGQLRAKLEGDMRFGKRKADKYS